jgi:hypothetical protein
MAAAKLKSKSRSRSKSAASVNKKQTTTITTHSKESTLDKERPATSGIQAKKKLKHLQNKK